MQKLYMYNLYYNNINYNKVATYIVIIAHNLKINNHNAKKRLICST